MRTRTCLSVFAAVLGLASASASGPALRYDDLESAPHRYSTSQPRDRVTQLKEALESGKLPLDRTSEKAYLASLLRELNIPASSQLWVFSTTSLQLRYISPSNPRAIYFNEDVYLGYIPGGRIELISMDPDLGAILYIFDIPRGEAPVRLERSDRCMNCHASEETGHVPGLILKSVTPTPSGGSLNAYRVGQTGHHIPLSDRFGGWHLTGKHGLTKPWADLIGRIVEGKLVRIPNPAGERFNPSKYLVETSDVLSHLLLEHQAGFANRVAEAAYRARTILFLGADRLTPDQEREFDAQARILVRYALFADEAPLPEGGIEGSPAFARDFLAQRKPDRVGRSLRDLDLKKRLFKHRCSYMIYQPPFQSLPAPLKNRISRRLASALDEHRPDPEFDYLPREEKRAIRTILAETAPGLLP